MSTQQNTLTLNKSAHSTPPAFAPSPPTNQPTDAVDNAKETGKIGEVKKVSAARKKFGESDIDLLKDALANAPAPERQLGKIDALAALAKEMREAHKSGHSYDQISQLLKTKGLEVTRRQVAEVLVKTGKPTASKSA